MGKKTGIEKMHAGNQVAPGSRRIYTIIGLVGLIITGILGYAFFKGDEMIRVYTPLVDAAMEIKLETTTAHLWFEEIISGDNQDISEVWKHQDQAVWYANAMLEGGKNPEGTFLPIDDTEMRGKIADVLQSLKEFRKITEERLASQELSGIGSEIDQRYDHLFQTFLEDADEVETQLQKVMGKDLVRFRGSQLSLIVITIFLFIAIELSFRHFDNQRRKNVFFLEEANRALQSSEENLSITLDSIGDAVITTDIQGGVVRMNPVAEGLTGWKLSDAMNQPLEKVFNIENQKTRKKVESPVEKALRSGTIVGLANHTVLISKNGTEYCIDDSAAPIKDTSGTVAGVVLIFRDITEKYAAEEKLRQSENRYRQLFEKSTDAIFIVDKATGRYLNANAAAEKLTGRSVSELKNMTARELTPEGASQRLETIGSKEDALTFGEVIYSRADGTKRIAELELVPLDSKTVFGIAQDITERKRVAEELRVSEERLRESARLARVGGWEIDTKGNTLAWTEETYRIHELDAHLLPDVEKAIQFYHPEDRERVIEAVQGAIDRGEAFDFEARLITAKQNRRWVRAIGKAVYLDDQLVGMRGMVQDITEHKQAEESLRENEAYIRTVMDNLPIGVAVNSVDPDVTFSYMNDNFPKFYRTTREALSDPDAFWEAVYEDPVFREKMRKRILADCAANDPQKMHWENVPITRGGQETAYVSAQNTPVSGNKIMISSVWDVTKRNQAEKELRESEERLQLVMEGSQLGYWDWNIETGEVNRNARWAEMLGYDLPEIELTVKQWRDLHHPDDRDAVWKSIQDHLDGKTPVHRLEYRMRAKDEQYKWILDQARIVKWDTDGKPVRMCGTHTDITERKYEEKERERLQTQLAQAQKMESVGRLAGGVAHDFNNMLSVILGRTEMILEDIDPNQSLHADLSEIKWAARRSADVTRQLLAFARKQTIAPKVVDLNDVIENILKMLRRLIGEDIELLWRPGKELWPVKMDPSQIDQILANLCVNARDAIDSEGKLTIETSNATIDRTYSDDHPGFFPGDFVQVTVSDNGCGMNKEVMKNLFEPFFTTKDADKGTGLGLATVYGIVKQNDGFINVYSEPDKGSSFKIYLRRHTISGERTHTIEKAETVLRGSESILLVEDEVPILKMTEQMLKRMGYTVLAANKPRDAINLARDYGGEIHLLLTDVIMPEINGQELFKSLLPIYPNLKCLFMSGYTANVIAHHGVLEEGIHYIQKPFSRQGLSVKLREVFEDVNT